jgi:Flp pilus assembly pilin Flp
MAKQRDPKGDEHMLRNFLKNRKAQNTAEYALLIALVVAGVIAMQTYAQRALQARIHDASTYMKDQTGNIGSTTQYEPYYLSSNYTVNTDSVENKRLGVGLVGQDSATNRTRTGVQNTNYSTADVSLTNSQ